MSKMHLSLGVLWGATVLVAAWLFLLPVTYTVPLTSSDQCREGVPECSVILNRGKSVVAGRTVEVKVHVQHLTEGIPVTVTVQMIGPQVVRFPQFNYTTSGGVSDFVNRNFVVPPGTLPGQYVLSFEQCFARNFVRTDCVITETEVFRVVSPSGL